MIEIKKEHIVKSLNAIKPREGYCGLLYEVLNPKNDKTEGFSIAVVIVEPGKKARAHCHKRTEEAYFVLDGRGVVTIEVKSHIVKKDDVIYIPINNYHWIENPQNEPLIFLTLNHPPFDIKDSHFLDEKE